MLCRDLYIVVATLKVISQMGRPFIDLNFALFYVLFTT